VQRGRERLSADERMRLARIVDDPTAAQSDAEWRFGTQQRYTLSQNFALRFDFNQRAGIQEYLFNLHGYF